MTKYQPDNGNAQQANATWQSLKNEEPLAEAVRDALDGDLPDRDPILKDLLSERLLSESSLATESKVDPKVVTLGESKVENGTKRDWLRWVGWTSAAAAACILIGSFLWLGGQSDREATAFSERQLRSAQGNHEDYNKRLRGNLPSGFVGREDQNSPRDNSRRETLSLDSSGSMSAPTSVAPNPTSPVPSTPTPSQKGFEMAIHTGDGPTLYSFKSDNSNTGKYYEGWQRGSDAYGLEDNSRMLGFRPTIERFHPTNEPFGERTVDKFGRVTDEQLSGERYNPIYENPFRETKGESALSTFSIDVDTASYSNMRRFLNSGRLPPPDSVRIEELVNYFNYDYPQPTGDDPFSVSMEFAPCPWNAQRMLLRVGLKGKEIDRDERPNSNLVFLVDVSGSMNNADKLPLLKRGLQLMVDHLTENDRVSIVAYAGNAGVVLEPTSGDQKSKINEAIERLSSGGSTHGSAGIEKAYDMAVNNLIEGGSNRVIWATDGDLNVGITDDKTLINLVSERAQEGIFLTTLGFGTGNLQDGKLEQIANNGNGIYAYIDSFKEAHKVLVQQMSGSLVTIAKDVKLQIEFNPAQVLAYRLIGYENRVLATEDFDNDAVDAGEIGAGHTVTAIYELQMSSKPGIHEKPTTKMKYQNSTNLAVQETRAPEPQPAAQSDKLAGELLTLALRYKQPESSESKRIEFVLKDEEARDSFQEASNDFRFTASVASFGMMLRGSKFQGETSLDWIEQTAAGSLGDDQDGYRAEFIDLVRRSKQFRN